MYNKEILSQQAGNALIKEAIIKDGSLMIARCGNSELNCCEFYFKNNTGKKKHAFPPNITKLATNNAGVFPVDNTILNNFSKIYLESLALTDIMAVWQLPFEDYVCNNICENADLIPLRSLEPYYDLEPWSINLKDQTVLVINSFAKTIETQYETVREKLFDNPAVLPPFKLKTYRSVQSIAGTKTIFTNWIDAYHYMCNDIEKMRFDVALIGAGGYGLPLAAFIKKMGKKAIYIGGAIQILFGIKGSRWKSHDIISQFFNPYWTEPSKKTETPSNYKMIEGGCYW